MLPFSELNTLVTAARITAKSAQATVTRVRQGVELISDTGVKHEFKSVGKATEFLRKDIGQNI
jgi:hypothetical protein